MSGIIAVRGAGDLASGVLLRLVHCGFRVIALECAQPSAIRRAAAFSEAVYDGTHTVEDITAERISNWQACEPVWQAGRLPVLVDAQAQSVAAQKPLALIDAILAKKNCGTSRDMAPITIALGPGFTAGVDADAVIETQRGHDLGRILYTGSALPNTGVPGVIAGYSHERVIHAPAAGAMHPFAQIGDLVEKGQPIAEIGGVIVPASLTGVLRGLIRTDYPVTAGLKIADIDPRVSEQKNCFTISDKSRCIAGGVLEALLHLAKERRLSLL